MEEANRQSAGPPATQGLRGMPAEQAPILELLIKLDDAPAEPVWRRVLVAADTRLDRFHDVIQAAMGWGDRREHLFTTAIGQVGEADPERDHRDGRDVTLAELLAEPGDRLGYAYGAEHPWLHTVVLERLLVGDPSELYPTCLAGGGSCPPDGPDARWDFTARRGPAARAGEGEELSEGPLAPGAEPEGGFDLEQAREALAFFSAVP